MSRSRGLYCNTATVSATGVASATDPACYTGGVIPPPTPRITIRKAVNALNPWAPTSIEDANTTPITVVTGTSVVYTYLVSNPGEVRLRLDPATAVLDDNGTPTDPTDDFHATYVGGDVNADGWLDLTETWLFTSTRLTVRTGTLTNRAVVVGCVGGPGTQCVTDDDTASYTGQTGAEGHTPGFWKTNVDSKGAIAWPHDDTGALVLDPTSSVRDLFTALPSSYDSVSLYDALGLNGGGVAALLRHAVSAVLNAIHPEVAYPLSAGEVIALVNAALTGGDPAAIEALKNLLAGYNELGSDLDANGNTPGTTSTARLAASATGTSSTSASPTSTTSTTSTTSRTAAPVGTSTLAASSSTSSAGTSARTGSATASGPVADLTAVRWAALGAAPAATPAAGSGTAATGTRRTSLSHGTQRSQRTHRSQRAHRLPWWKAARGAAPGTRA